MKIESVFGDALLRYIRAEVDQLAEGIRSYDTAHTCCYGHEYDDSCCCDTGIKVEVDYRVPREVSRFGYRTWTYNGGFAELINMLDSMDMEVTA